MQSGVGYIMYCECFENSELAEWQLCCGKHSFLIHYTKYISSNKIAFEVTGSHTYYVCMRYMKRRFVATLAISNLKKTFF